MAQGGSRRWWLVGLVATAAFVFWSYWQLPSASPLATRNPDTTALIEARAVEAKAKGQKPRRKQTWVPFNSISKVAVQAVLTSEDSGFYRHEGIDTVELKKAVSDSVAKGRLGRGASTITQQLAKNLWLSGERSLWRKGKELILAKRLEQALSKQRILTLYLNVVEWGDGIYGIEAASREYFGVSAAELNLGESAILAAMLPAPRKRHPNVRSKAAYQRAMWVIDQLEGAGRVDSGQALGARAEVEGRIGSGSDVDESDDEP